MTFEEASNSVPIIAILRGVTPERAPEIAAAVFESGIRLIETPLNSPRPFESIAAMAAALGTEALIGAGTVLSTAAVEEAADAGARMIVAPDSNAEVIARALALDLEVLPGFATPTEAFLALRSGARRLKLFPAGSLGTAHLAHMKAVLPASAEIWAVGGVAPDSFASWFDVGIAGFGLGGEIYRAGRTPLEVRERARRAVEAARAATKSRRHAGR